MKQEIRHNLFKIKLLLVGSCLLFLVSGSFAVETLTPDELWMKSRLEQIHERYASLTEHERFLEKMHDAYDQLVSPEARDALEEIIGRREDLKPVDTDNGALSAEQEVVSEKDKTQDVEEIVAVSRTLEGKATYQLMQGNIDITTLQNTWLGWVNELRTSRGLKSLTLHPALHKTAADRSESMKKKGVADHRRYAKSAYYAYGEIEAWFAQRGVNFVNVSRATFTENIGWSTFRCKKTDCTSEAIDAMRQTFEFYLSEEGTTNNAHRRTLIHPLFTIVGLGIAVDETTGKFYLTTHYGTEIE